MERLFIYFAIAQGGFVIGITMFILGYYLPKFVSSDRSQYPKWSSKYLRWFLVLYIVANLGLTLATIRTAASGVFGWGDFWYWCVVVSYIIEDASLLLIFRHVIRLKRLRLFEEELKKDAKERDNQFLNQKQ